jgi:radical SAM superfamily enzyme YgiQ (UPF0313 family)
MNWNDYPPLGLAYLAAVLKEDGHDVQVFDLGLDPDAPLEHGAAQVAAFDPHLVGITAMTNLYLSALETATLLKANLGRPIALGGPHPTVFPHRVLSEAPVIDYVVRGEGEETLRQLVRNLDNGARHVGAIEGLTYRVRDEVVSNPDRPLIRDLDALPFPARHLFDLKRYGLCTPAGEPMITVLSSRGCPYNCSYCFKGIVGRTYRQRSPGNIIAELRQVIDRYGVRNFYFIDDLFTINLQRLEALTQQMISEQLDVRWQCLARVDRVNPEILKQMYAAGCRRIHYGIESGNQQVLDRVGKRIKLSLVRQAVRWTQDAGIETKGYFMLGLPGDTEETLQQTVSLAAQLDLDEAMFSLTTPFPGTRLWDELVKKRPGTEYNQDFTRAYYYGDPDEDLVPFLNVSEVSDAALVKWMHIANRTLAESKSRRVYHRAFGRHLGPVLWRLARLRPLRVLARRLIKLGLFGRFAQLRAKTVKTW